MSLKQKPLQTLLLVYNFLRRVMIRYILALLLFFFPIFVFSSEKIEVGEDIPTEAEYKQSAEDAKFQDDSEICYDDAEKLLKKDSSAKKLNEDDKSERLDGLFSECMTKKGHNMNEESADKPEVKE